MGRDSPDLHSQTSLGAPLPEAWSVGVSSFIESLQHAFEVQCVILHGSFATGKWIEGSDVDLVAIADGLPSSFLKRIELVSSLSPRGVPLEVLAYTPEEFSEMLDTMHVTALEATSRGIALAGPAYFSRLKTRFDEMTKKGLRRGKSSWYWEKAGRE